MWQQADRQMNQLYEQMDGLARHARAILQRKEISDRIYESAMGFEPLINETYFMNEKEDGTGLLSLIAPHEWGIFSKYGRYTPKCLLLADHTWEVDYNQA